MFSFLYTGRSNGESLILCLMKCMAMEPCRTKALSMSLEESLKASTSINSRKFYHFIGFTGLPFHTYLTLLDHYLHSLKYSNFVTTGVTLDSTENVIFKN